MGSSASSSEYADNAGTDPYSVGAVADSFCSSRSRPAGGRPLDPRTGSTEMLAFDHVGQKARIEQMLIQARSHINEVTNGAGLSGPWVEKLQTSEKLLRMMEVELGACRLPSSIDMAKAGEEVKSYITGERKDGSLEAHIFGGRCPPSSSTAFPAQVPDIMARLSSSPDAKRLLQEVGGFDVDTVAIAELPEVVGKPIAVLATYSLQQRGLQNFLPTNALNNLDRFQERLLCFFGVVDEAYRNAVYHNRYHGADVMLMMDWFTRTNYMKKLLHPFDILISIIAAACHDMGHDGVNNLFHQKTHSWLALRYNDRSVLENMHVSLTFELMHSHEEYNWLTLLNEYFTADDSKKPINLQQYVRDLFTSMVLMTDNTHHNVLMGKLTELLKEEEDPAVSGDQASGPCSRDGDLHRAEITKRKTCMLEVLLHAADVSNPTRREPTMLYWTQCVLGEFWAQGDQEKRLGLEVSPLCDRAAGMASVPAGQLGFVNFVVAPLFKQLTVLMQEVTVATDQLTSNVAFWTKQKEAGATYETLWPAKISSV
eukprot:gnl/TRDRNA2_/TRDRNA2_159219_c0_seq1.p1 gnl/TRDRNA2_/TRDRNA2_159219_c0~~gnl/TRDRNA2_/TRDRNA2_159219_c0_seq1.p1  ORF type:complete len:540 (-),score=112.68 gnl/TRDRNA2_/TRDRNA2_159219_c0_seq1:59-1678(-)